MEKLADRVGRGIRYGEPPNVDRIGPLTVGEVIQSAMGWSDLVGSVEDSTREIKRMGLQHGADQGALQLRLREIRATTDQQMERLRQHLAGFIELVELLVRA